MAQTGIIDKKKGLKLNPRSFLALLMCVAVSGAYYYFMHKLHLDAISHHPGHIMLLPVLGMSWLAFNIPLFMFIAYPDDFKSLNPILPHHYFYIARKAYRALQANNFKVSEKDL